MNEARETQRKLKTRIRLLLLDNDFAEAMTTLKDFPARRVVNPLMSFFCSGDMLLRWRAVSGMGEVMNHLADMEMESARVIMRRLMWTLNDESGGIGWGAPEAMGEITARHRTLADEFGCILVSYIRTDCNFLEHPILQRGVLWGLGRLAHARPAMVADAAAFMRPFLESDDAFHRGHAAWGLRALGETALDWKLPSLAADRAIFSFYQNGRLADVAVADMAQGTLPLQK